MKRILLTIQVIFFAFFIGSRAQENQLTAKDTIVQSSWMVSLGINIVDDSGDEFGNLIDLEDGWNMVPFPSRISVGRYFKNGVGLEAIGTYNHYKEGKIVDNVVNTENIDYFGIDFRVSYDLNQILGETGFFDPYVGIGAGYTDANNQGRGTYNAAVGFRTWFSDHWGVDFNSTGKWTMNTENSSNHIQHAIGVVYQFDIEKGLSPKGEEKLTLLQELEKEQQRVQDSIAAKNRADEEARLLAEKLEREREAAQLAEAERAKQEAESAKRNKNENKIKDLGNVYFALNSSYLTQKDKELLDKLASILADAPNLEIEISAHADSRGTDEYNQWLSERRAKRTVEYIVKKGIDANRLSYQAFGERRLTNACKDQVQCSENNHSLNRRSEFRVVKLMSISK